MSVPRINGVRLPDDRPLTAGDLDLLPDDGDRYELTYGVLQVTPAPSGPHQDVLHRLEFLLELFRPATFKVMRGQGVGPRDDPTRYRIPGTAVFRFDERGSCSAVLAVEVSSPGTVLLDRNVKKAEYEEFGIESYWIVVPDPDHPGITAYELRDGRYAQVADVAGGEIFRTERPYPFTTSPRQLVTDEEW